MDTVLITTDFSPTAHNAVNYVMNLLKGRPTRYVLLHSYESPQAGASMVVSVNEMLRVEAEKAMKRELARILDNSWAPTVPIEGKVVYGDLRDAIEKVRSVDPISMLVMGTTGASGYRYRLLGSNAAYMITHLDIPTLAVPHEARYQPIHRITLAVDEKGVDPATNMGPLTKLLEASGATLSVINVQVEKEITKPPLAWLEDLPHEYRVLSGQSVQEGIEAELTRNRSDLLVVVHREHDFFERIFRKSISRDMTLHMKVPILVIHEA